MNTNGFIYIFFLGELSLKPNVLFIGLGIIKKIAIPCSILVPEQYVSRYQFYEISFNKITFSQKKIGFIFSTC